MNARYIIHTIEEEQVLELNPSEAVINNAQDFLQMMAHLPADLKTGLPVRFYKRH